MPEILDYPDLGVGDEVGISIEYFSTLLPLVPNPALIQPKEHIWVPTWNQLFGLLKLRLSEDKSRFKIWVKSKWQRIRHH